MRPMNAAPSVLLRFIWDEDKGRAAAGGIDESPEAMRKEEGVW